MSVLDARELGPPGGRKPSFTLGNRIRRAIWAAAWLVLASWTPPPLHAWRVLVLRLFGARIGRNCRIYRSTRVWNPAELEIGDEVTIGPGVILYNQGRITIGDTCVISQRAHLCASTHRFDDAWFQLILKPITIGQNCWVAAEAFVGPGVVMGDGAVLAARGVLFDAAEPFTVYRGNPAVAIGRRRFSAGEGAAA